MAEENECADGSQGGSAANPGALTTRRRWCPRVTYRLHLILAGVRNCPGVTPTRRLKWRVSWLWSEKPASAATSARDTSVAPWRSCLARSTRRRMTYWCGASPVARLNWQAKELGLGRATAAHGPRL